MITAPTILCPLSFEAAALATLQRQGLATVLRTGPGPQRVVDAVGRVPRDVPLILAGLATALTNELSCGDVVWADRICGVATLPTCTVSGDMPHRHVAMCGVRDVLPNRPCRLAVARATGAIVADLECQAFAEAAADRPGQWGVVRGISDDVNAELPPVERWVHADGRTRHTRVAGWLAMHPWSLRRVMRLGRNASTAMAAVRQALVEVLAGDGV